MDALAELKRLQAADKPGELLQYGLEMVTANLSQVDYSRWCYYIGWAYLLCHNDRSAYFYASTAHLDVVQGSYIEFCLRFVLAESCARLGRASEAKEHFDCLQQMPYARQHSANVLFTHGVLAHCARDAHAISFFVVAAEEARRQRLVSLQVRSLGNVALCLVEEGLVASADAILLELSDLLAQGRSTPDLDGYLAAIHIEVAVELNRCEEAIALAAVALEHGVGFWDACLIKALYAKALAKVGRKQEAAECASEAREESFTAEHVRAIRIANEVIYYLLTTTP